MNGAVFTIVENIHFLLEDFPSYLPVLIHRSCLVALDHNAGGHVFEHYTIAGLVGGLAPWAMSFHELFFELTLIQGE